MKNILYVTDTGSIMGGGEISLFNLLENLDRSSFSLFVALPQEGDLSRRLKEMGIPVLFFSYKKVFAPFSFKSTAAAIARICAIIREHRIALVHTNSTGGIVFLAGIACALTRAPLVSHSRLIYTGVISDVTQGLLAQKIIVVSNMIARKTVFRLFKDKVTCIYNGLDLAKWKADADGGKFRSRLGIPAEAPMVVAVGTYARGKGFEYLIQALAVLKSRFPGLRAVIIGLLQEGSASYRHRLEHIAQRLKVADMITFLPQQDDMPSVYAAMDVFCFTSLIDSFGRVLIEAMACSRPAVAFSHGGAPEIIEDGKTGFLVAPRDHRQLAQKIETLLKDKALAREFGRQGRARCAQLFDIKRHAAEVEKLYDEVLHDPASGYVACAVCGSRRFKVITRCRITEADAPRQETLDLCRCQECGLVYINPQPRIGAEFYSKEYFDKGYMKFYSGDSRGAVQSNEPFTWRINRIERFKKPGSLLDIGCATGEFLEKARERGWSVTGIDVSEYAVETARRAHNLDVRRSTLEEARFPEKSFDAVTGGDILEHTADPGAFVREIRRILKDDGILYLALPNFASAHYKIMSFMAKFNHKNYFVLPHHLYHFTPRTLGRLLEEAGFQVRHLALTESSIQETGARRLIMKIIFLLGRITGKKDRIVLIAEKTIP